MRTLLLLCALVLSASAMTTLKATIPPLASNPWTSADLNVSSYDSTPVAAVTSNGLIFVASQGWTSSVAAVNGTNGALKWSIMTGLNGYSNNYPLWLAVQGSTVVFATSWYVAGLNAVTGATLWNSSFADNYVLSATSQPQWLDASNFVAMLSLSNSYARLIKYNVANGANTSLWNSTDNYPSSSYFGLNGAFTLASIQGSWFVVQVFQGQYWGAINISNASGFVRYTYSNDISSINYNYQAPVVANDTIFFGGVPSSSSTYSIGAIVGYALNGSKVWGATFPGSYTVQYFSYYNANGGEGFAVYANTYSTCRVFSVALNGTVLGAYAMTNTSSQNCYIIATSASGFYLNDDDLNLYGYTFGTVGFTWSAYSLYGNSGYTYSGNVVNGKLYVSKNYYLNGSYAIPSSALQVNLMSGAYEAFLPTARSNSYSLSLFVYDAFSFGGTIVGVGRSNGGQTYLLAFLPPTPGASSGQWLAQAATGIPTVYNGVVYFVATNTIYAFGLSNGTMLWSQYVASQTSSSTTFDPSVAPAVANSKLYVLAYSYYSSDAAVFYVFDLWNKSPMQTISSASASGLTACGTIYRPQLFVTYPGDDYVYFASRGTCVVRLNAGATPVANQFEAAKITNTVNNRPIVGDTYVYFNDYLGYVYKQRKSAFTSTTDLLNRWKSSSSSPSSPSPLISYSDSLYTTSTPEVDQFGSTTLSKNGKGTLTITDDSVPPILFNNAMFVVTSNGSFVSFGLTAGLLSMSLPQRFFVSPPAGFGSYSLGVPAVVPWGVFVFGNMNGIVAFDWNGMLKFAITKDINGYSLSCSNPTAYRTGIVYVVCNGQLQLVDVLGGRIWMSGPAFTSGYPVTTVVDTSSDLSLGVFTICSNLVSAGNLTTRLYQPAALPASLLNGPSTLDELEQNKIWIAGAVAGLIVLIIIVAVAVKLCSGGKKDTDYVAMQNPVNNGV